MPVLAACPLNGGIAGCLPLTRRHSARKTRSGSVPASWTSHLVASQPPKGPSGCRGRPRALGPASSPTCSWPWPPRSHSSSPAAWTRPAPSRPRPRGLWSATSARLTSASVSVGPDTEAVTSFTTGGDLAGYTLTSIRLLLRSNAFVSAAEPKVSLRSGSATGTEVATLTGTTAITFQTEYAFTPASPVNLDPSIPPTTSPWAAEVQLPSGCYPKPMKRTRLPTMAGASATCSALAPATPWGRLPMTQRVGRACSR